MRAETPDAWFTNSLPRAEKATSSTSSRVPVREHQLYAAGAVGPGLLRRDLHGRLPVVGIVRDDLRVDAVLQRRDDVAAVGVVLRVRGVDHEDVERHADRETADLDVFFFQDIEQPDLDAGRQVGELVDGEDPAVAARDDPEMDDPFVGVGQLLASPP